MADTEFMIEEYDNTEPPPFFHTPMEKLPGRITSVELTTHEKYGDGFRFHLHMTGDDTGDTVWYTTGKTKSARNKLGKLGLALYGTLEAVPANVKEFVGSGIDVMFEHTPPSKADDKWVEKVIAITTRKLTKTEEAEDVMKHELAAKESPF